MDIKLDIYNENCFNLANSMYLKFDLHALEIERWYTGTKNVNPDKTTWLQYMNLAGQYHEANEPMVIKSLDTFEDISFDKETLNAHPTTLLLYREFGKYFNALIKKYPDNEVLIKGILYGRDINDIINMDDFHIVGWNENLIDTQEYDLISRLNQNLTILGTRAGSPNYIESQPRYPSIIMAKVAAELPTLIKRVRLECSKTYMANTFYIWSNINSVINLEKYKSVLTYDDVMYLFKNIIRLKDGLCTKDVFHEVLTTIVTPKMIDAYYLESNVQMSSVDNDNQITFAEWQNRNVVSDDVRPTTLTAVAIDHDTRSNYRISDTETDISQRVYRDYNSNQYAELTLYDNRETEGDIRELLINVDYSFLFGGLNLITRYYELTLPNTGESITLPHRDWLTIYKRLLQIRFGKRTETIPPHTTTQLYKYTPITLSSLLSVGLTQETAQEILNIVGTFPNIKNDIAGTLSYVDNFNNTRGTITSILSRAYDKYNALTIGAANSLIFGSYIITYHPENTNYSEWLNAKDIDLESMSHDTRIQLEYLILTSVIGISSDDANSMVNMIGGLLEKFLSYKTNISRKMSDKVTLNMGLRPTWSRRPIDSLGTSDFILTSSSVRTLESGDTVSLTVSKLPELKTSMSRKIGISKVGTGQHTVTGTDGSMKKLVNVNSVQITTTLSEPSS